MNQIKNNLKTCGLNIWSLKLKEQINYLRKDLQYIAKFQILFIGLIKDSRQY